MTPNLVIQTLGRIWIALEQHGIKPTLVGGLALPIWNYPRSTQDIDLLLLVEDHQLLQDICPRLHCRPRRDPAVVELGSIRVLQTESLPPDEYVEIDVDFLLGQSDFHATLSARAVSIHYGGIEVPLRVATCEDLILLKLQSGRLIDLADCQRLIELNPDLDWKHLDFWAGKLQLVEALSSVRDLNS